MRRHAALSQHPYPSLTQRHPQVPAIFCLDDAFLANNLPPLTQKIALWTPATPSYLRALAVGASGPRRSPTARSLVSAAFFLLMAKLNVNVVRNLCARPQIMVSS